MIVQMFVANSGAHLASAEGDGIHVRPMGLDAFAVGLTDPAQEVQGKTRVVRAMSLDVVLGNGPAYFQFVEVQLQVVAVAFHALTEVNGVLAADVV